MTDTAGSSGFGPSALATPANGLTMARLLATPIFILLIANKGASWWTVACGVLVTGSDGLDGWLARRQGKTRSGAFLDPLADKLVVLSALVLLSYEQVLPWLPVLLIGGRELLMSVYRSWMGRRGVSVPASRSGKIKTLVQDLAIATCLVPPLAQDHRLQLVAIWVAAAFTVASGVQYAMAGRRSAQVSQ
ncbi:MAG: CDP-diacylglycerol--glycerol-3-phosphate 3-phosphatidyltransferase [Acidimicrobiales bacterium]